MKKPSRCAPASVLSAAATLWLLGSAVASAQLPRTLIDRRVAEIHIAGETSGVTSARDVGIPIGAPLTRRLLRSTLERLLETGRWADVQIDAQPRGRDVVLVVRLQPRVVITRIDVIGNEVLSDDEVRQSLRLNDARELEGPSLQPLAEAVLEAYVEQGYAHAQVRIRMRDTDDPAQKVLRIELTEGEPIRIASYVFEGAEPPDDVDIPDEIGVGVDDVLDIAQLRAGRRDAEQALRAAGFFEARLGPPDVRPVDGDDEVVIAMSLRLGPRYTVRMVGNEPIEHGDIEDALDLEETRLTRRTFEQVETRVLALYRRHGYHHAEVEVVRYAGEEAGTAVLELQIEHGRQIHVVGMSFPGATHFESDYLRSQVVSVLEEELPDTRFFSPVDSDTADRLGLGGTAHADQRRRSIAPPLSVDPSRVYYEPLYARAVEHLTEVYQAAGFLSARIQTPTLRAVGRGRAVVVVQIVEGARTLLFDLTLGGNVILSERALLEAAGLRRGEPFSYLALEEAITHMTELYQERGYIYARIEPAVRFSQDRERAEVVLTIVERIEVRFGEVTIEGAENTQVSLIRDVLRIEPGELYRPSVVRASQTALMSLGIFRAVNIVPADQDVVEPVKPIIVTVRERDPGFSEIRLGFYTGQGARVNGEFGYNNVGGYALSLTVRGELAFQVLFQDVELEENISGLSFQDRLERRFTGTVGLPRIPDVDNLRATLDLVHIRDNQRAFGYDKLAAILSLIWSPERGLTFTVAADVEYNDVQLFSAETIAEILEREIGNPQVLRLLRVPEGESAFTSVRVSGTVDQRDNPFVPTEGWFGSGTVEWVHSLLPDQQAFSHFLRLTGTLNGYLSLGDWVLAGQFRTGGIVHLEPTSESYPQRQFFLGGVNTLRGLNQDQLQPQDIVDNLEAGASLPTTVLRGSEFFYLVRVELRIPIVDGFSVGVFGDVGNHWADPNLIQLDESFFRVTPGLGLRIATPVGPVAFDFGINATRRAELNEPEVAFQFSIGLF